MTVEGERDDLVTLPPEGTVGAGTHAVGGVVRRHEPLSAWTTFGVGGPAAEMVDIVDIEALAPALGPARPGQQPVMVLGGGSNVLFSDGGFEGRVVHIGLQGCRAQRDGSAVVVSVAAGENWGTFVEGCVDQGWSGVECLSGVPGLVGATPIQNVGAYGQEVQTTIRAVTAWDRRRGGFRQFAPEECQFSYRRSIFKRGKRFVITEVSFRLERSRSSQPVRYPELAKVLGCRLGQRAPLEDVAEAVVALRRRKGMVIDPGDPDTRSAGSFFTNPVLDAPRMAHLLQVAPDVPRFPAPGGTKVPAAWLVERAGFERGFRLGSVSISSKHCLALTAPPGASATELVALARRVRRGVKDRFDVLLEPEPVLVGLHL